MTEKNKITISYLVPSYNHEKYVFASLESIKLDIRHLYESAEIVIVDDASSDSSPRIIEKWVNANKNEIQINFILLPENKGIPAVFNKLVTLANGIFLRFSGSDDLLLPGSTRMLLDGFSGRSNVTCVFGDATVIGDNDEIIYESSIAYHGGKVARLDNPNKLKKELIQNWCLAGPSFLIRKSHYDVMRYDESLKIDDYDLYLSLLERPRAVSFLNALVCNYRVHNSNTSKTTNAERRIENLSSFLSIIDRYLNRGVIGSVLISVKYKTIAKIKFLNREYVKSMVYLAYHYILKIRYFL